jgi:hypothetical protein
MEHDRETLLHQYLTLDEAVSDSMCATCLQLSVVKLCVGKMQDAPMRSETLDELDNAG